MTDSTIIYSKTFDISKSGSITIQISKFNGKDLLNIYKSTFSEKYTGIAKDSSIAFASDQYLDLLNIVESIPMDYEIKECGQIGKYKVYVSTFNGNNSFQIREWVESETYTGYGKKWVSFSMEKISDFKEALTDVTSHFKQYLNGELVQKEQKTTSDTDIESYF
ncbi:MAG: hypothetical protein ACD_71C00130G0004 [uncultured bacterium (gcode 4)]|uniref:Transcriptional coactivator p15 (PC4) C-terminal domain-containing protein n=1 Tax=uncultured bacterium (gcode 4) TaxID=1234023 RepID=K1Z4G4_9BACT|nr:MAG: hypothetical protein ACD_71C00130G0004 [uncultured bacterium (gcode 4)]